MRDRRLTVNIRIGRRLQPWGTAASSSECSCPEESSVLTLLCILDPSPDIGRKVDHGDGNAEVLQGLRGQRPACWEERSGRHRVTQAQNQSGPRVDRRRDPGELEGVGEHLVPLCCLRSALVCPALHEDTPVHVGAVYLYASAGRHPQGGGLKFVTEFGREETEHHPFRAGRRHRPPPRPRPGTPRCGLPTGLRLAWWSSPGRQLDATSGVAGALLGFATGAGTARAHRQVCRWPPRRRDSITRRRSPRAVGIRSAGLLGTAARRCSRRSTSAARTRPAPCVPAHAPWNV